MGKKKGHKRGIPKTVGGWLSLTFHVIGSVVVAAPAIQAGIKAFNAKDFTYFPGDVLYNYTGVSMTDGNINLKQTTVGIGSVAGGIGLAKLGSYLGRIFH